MTQVRQRTDRQHHAARAVKAAHHEEHVLDDAPLFLDDLEEATPCCRSERQAQLRRERRARSSVSLLASGLLVGCFSVAVIIVELAK